MPVGNGDLLEMVLFKMVKLWNDTSRKWWSVKNSKLFEMVKFCKQRLSEMVIY